MHLSILYKHRSCWHLKLMLYRHVFSEGKEMGRERQPSKRQAEGQKTKQRGRERHPSKRQAEGQKAKQEAKVGRGGEALLEAIRGGSPAHHKAPLHFVKGVVIHAHVSRACCHYLHNTTKILMQQQQPLQSAFSILCGHRHSFTLSRVGEYLCMQTGQGAYTA